LTGPTKNPGEIDGEEKSPPRKIGPEAPGDDAPGSEDPPVEDAKSLAAFHEFASKAISMA
jgi:hypothetical protein